MNKCWYSAGESFKVKVRKKHYCYKCGGELEIFTHQRIVERGSEEADYYRYIADTAVVLPCEFFHKAFYCSHCDEKIEFNTQISFEDIDIVLDKVVKYFAKKGMDVSISKSYETVVGEQLDKIEDISQIRSLHLTVVENGQSAIIYVLPIKRSSYAEREYYFRLSKRKLIKSIKKN